MPVSRRSGRRVSRRAGRRVSRRAGRRGSRRRTRQRGGNISKAEFKAVLQKAASGGKGLAEVIAKTGATLTVAGTQISVKTAALMAHLVASGCDKGFEKLAEGLHYGDDHIDKVYAKISPESNQFAQKVHLIAQTDL